MTASAEGERAVAVELQVSSLGKSFGGERVVSDISFAVSEGEVVSILGPSGCGKTTLLRMIAGLELPDGGRMSLGGRTVYRDCPFAWTPPERRGVGMVFQDFGLWPHLTVRQNVAFAARYGRREAHGRSRRGGHGRPPAREVDERVAAALQATGIAALADRMPHQLSGGQQQRVAFARATAARPRLLLLDEPFNALDAELRRELRAELLSMLRRDRFTVLHVTHDQEEALAISDRILVMSGGRVLQYDTPENLYHAPLGAAVASFVGRSNLIPVRVEVEGGSAMRLALADRRTYTADRALYDRSSAPVEPGAMIALIRPEDLVLAAARRPGGGVNGGGEVGLDGTVDDVQFLGDRYAVWVAVPDVGSLLCYAPRRVAAGAAVTLRAPLGCVHLLPCGDGAPLAQATDRAGREGDSG